MACAGVALGYVVVSLWLTPIPRHLLFHNSLYVLTANLLGMLIAYCLELSARRNFFLGYVLNLEQQKVKRLNARLEDKVERRTLALSTANTALQREVAEREKIESALRESRERLKILFDFAPDGCCMLNMNGDIIEGNRAAASPFLRFA